MSKKVIIISIVSIIVLALGISAFIMYKIEEDKRLEMEEDAVAVTFKDNLTVDFASKVKLSEFITNLNGELVEDFYVDTGVVGENQIEFKYISQRNKPKTKTFSINVVDKIAPVVYMQGSMTVGIGYNKDLAYVFLSGDNADPKPKREIIGDYDTSKEGKYKLKFVITDASGNKTENDFVLNVVAKTNTTQTNTQREKILFSDCIERYKTSNSSIGIDVSKWQGDINWSKVKNAGVEFAFIRIGYQDGFGGECGTDKYFEKNIKEATEAGVKVGVYLYSYAKTVEEANSQVDWIYEQIKDYNVSLPIVFDWENWASFSKAEMSFYDINNVAKTFVKRAEEHGYKGMLYSSKNYLEKVWYVNEFENIWLAHYTSKTSYTGNYDFWQMCDTGRVDGISGAVDIDIWYK